MTVAASDASRASCIARRHPRISFREKRPARDHAPTHNVSIASAPKGKRRESGVGGLGCAMARESRLK